MRKTLPVVQTPLWLAQARPCIPLVTVMYLYLYIIFVVRRALNVLRASFCNLFMPYAMELFSSALDSSALNSSAMDSSAQSRYFSAYAHARAKEGVGGKVLAA